MTDDNEDSDAPIDAGALAGGTARRLRAKTPAARTEALAVHLERVAAAGVAVLEDAAMGVVVVACRAGAADAVTILDLEVDPEYLGQTVLDALHLVRFKAHRGDAPTGAQDALWLAAALDEGQRRWRHVGSGHDHGNKAHPTHPCEHQYQRHNELATFRTILSVHDHMPDAVDDHPPTLAFQGRVCQAPATGPESQFAHVVV